MRFINEIKLLLFQFCGCEVWGIDNNNAEIVKIGIQFYKYIINANQRTPKRVVLSDLGKILIYVLCKQTLLMQCFKLISKKKEVFKVCKMYKLGDVCQLLQDPVNYQNESAVSYV